MTSPIRSQVNIALMLRDNLPAALRDLDGQIKQTEIQLEELRRNRTTLTQVAIAAGIDTSSPTPAEPETPAETTGEGEAGVIELHQKSRHPAR